MNEKRSAKRHNLYSSIWVRDHESGEELGEISDISVHGAQVVGTHSFEVERTYRLRLELPEEILGKREAILDARCIWCSRDTGAQFHTAGFHFVQRGSFIEGLVSLIFDYTM